MNTGFPRLNVPLEIRHKMTELAREFRKEPTPGEKILRHSIKSISQNEEPQIPSSMIGEGKGAG